MNSKIRIALPQINTTVGDLDGNTEKILAAIAQAEKSGADIVVFPELTITGYPPEDLLLKKKFIADNQACLTTIAEKKSDIVALVGFVDQKQKLYNSAALIYNGKIFDVVHKIELPNYSVFDEKRYFESGDLPMVFEFKGIKFGVTICEDIWTDRDISECQAFLGGAEVLLNLSASPYYVQKREVRLALVMKHARRSRAVMAMCNLVGGQDELIFDGNSLVVDHRGELLAEGKQLEEDFIVVDLDLQEQRRFRTDDVTFVHDKRRHQACYDLKYVAINYTAGKTSKPPLQRDGYKPLPKWEEVYRALTLGTSDYLTKNGFEKVVIGLSGGIDSALTTAIAVDALGPRNVFGVMMPSEFTSQQSMADAKALAGNLGIQTETISIRKIFRTYLDELAGLFEGQETDITEENLQARIRGNLLMALSNKFGWLVLTTGNKSEISVGYSTLYGDTAGGFAVIKDVPKTWVYELCRYKNEHVGTMIIPQSILEKPPTAELKPDQTDQDSLPPYDILDAILEEFVEKDNSVKEIIQQGYDREIVKRVAHMVDVNEYKRRQAPPGIKITHKAFGKDRRMPITNRYKI